MKLNDAYPSKWLAAADCEDEPLNLTIALVEMEDMKGPNGTDRKLRVGFREDVKDMILNKTNAGTVGRLYGDDTDDWLGKRITVYATDVEFQGKMTRGLRVSTKAPKTASSKAAPAPAGARSQQPATVENDDDEDIPF